MSSLNRLEQRVERLEDQHATKDRKMWVVDQYYETETEDAALARAGITPAPNDLVVFVTTYLAPSEQGGYHRGEKS